MLLNQKTADEVYIPSTFELQGIIETKMFH